MIFSSLNTINYPKINTRLGFKSGLVSGKQLKIEVLSGVSPYFQDTIAERISKYPFLDKIINSAYETIMCKSVMEAAEYKKIAPEKLQQLMKQHNTNSDKMQACCLSAKNIDGKHLKLIIFPECPVVTHNPGVVNHEFSHAICELDNLTENPEIIEAYLKDNQAINPKKINSIEKGILSSMKKNTQLSTIDEHATECIAWQCKLGGAYGNIGGYVPFYIPDLMERCFPTLFTTIKKIYF